jgi:hypothetical protein
MDKLLRFIFPLRYHLMDEVEYLKQQLAQARRRVDELQDALALAAIPKEAAPRPARPLPPLHLKTRSFEELRRKHNEELKNAAKESQTAKSAVPEVGEGVSGDKDAVGADVQAVPV